MQYRQGSAAVEIEGLRAVGGAEAQLGDARIHINVHLIGAGLVDDGDVVRRGHDATLPVCRIRPVAARRIDPTALQSGPHRDGD